MKIFNDYLTESSLSKIQNAWSNHDTGAITAFRYAEDCGEGEILTMKEKRSRNGVLKSKLLKRGYGVTKIKGSWFENGDIEKGEMSWFVVDLKDSGKLKRDLVELGEFFEQDSIAYATNGNAYYMISTNKCENSSPGFGRIGVEKYWGSPKFGKTGKEGFSKIGGRPFVFEKVVSFDVKQNYHPTERRSIEYIDEGYPTKEVFLQKFKEFRYEGRF